ncbi:MAG: DNA replication/repair protein RecF [Actinomycetota bacterium]|jgi:DNA replication and repair protein RecF|nr:DNA replication/repair protein RecF [Actinomycetota bacterium]
MYLKKLELINYRNYSKVNLDFGKDTILIIGNNGNGKTNLLESIHYLSTGKSHRTYTQDEIIKWGSKQSWIRAIVGSDGVSPVNHLIEIEMRKDNETRIKVDKTTRRKKTDFVSILPTVIFSPDDLKIIKDGPSERRNFLDSLLEKIDSSYYRQRLQYQKILAQRNSLIKSAGKSAGSKIDREINLTLEAWDSNLVKYGSSVIKKRYELLDEIRPEFKDYMENFFKGVSADIFYVFSWNRKNMPDSFENESSGNYQDVEIQDEDNSVVGSMERNLEEVFYRKLRENIDKDMQYKITTIGPHRDDFVILLNGKNLRFFGSQGQQRVASICLRLCELDILKEKIKEDPVLLLDDVFSELDIERKKMLVKAVKNKFQTFITATNMSYLDKLDMEFGSKLLVMDNGITPLDL